jgi:hypothetical protein
MRRQSMRWRPAATVTRVAAWNETVEFWLTICLPARLQGVPTARICSPSCKVKVKARLSGPAGSRMRAAHMSLGRFSRVKMASKSATTSLEFQVSFRKCDAQFPTPQRFPISAAAMSRAAVIPSPAQNSKQARDSLQPPPRVLGDKPQPLPGVLRDG